METVALPEIDLLETARDLAVKLALQVGELQLAAVKSGSTIHHKGTIDLVTDADLQSEQIISAGIRQAFPAHMLTGEEGAEGATRSEYCWYVDPIDGTTNFAHGQPHWAVSICLAYQDEPVMGVVYDVAKDEMFTAIAEQGAYLNGERIQVTTTDEIMQAIGATGFSYDISERAMSFRLWEAFNNGAQAMRRNGAAALDMVWVACGRLDFYFERPINSWDVSAGVVIAREAGATVSAMDGGPYRLEDRNVAASNGALHRSMLELIDATVVN